jgi:cysteine desulfurase
MIYLDNNATTPCAKEVIEAMKSFWDENFGNPSSSHLAGRKAATAISEARKNVANLIGCKSGEIVFTSGATESNNLLFLGVLFSDLSKEKRRIVTTPIEHKSVLEPLSFLEKKGFEIAYLPVTKDGVVDLNRLDDIISDSTVLVSVQAANNEIGTIQPIRRIAEKAHSCGAFFHADAAQVLGKIPFSVNDIACDFASFSAHKLYGPKGIGAIFVRGGSRRWPFAIPFHGGGQEGVLRPGTSNVTGIVGFGEACRLAMEKIPEDVQRIYNLRKKMEDRILAEIPDCIIHAYEASRLPGTVSVAFPGVPADILIANCKGFCISSGSACSSGVVGNSHVLSQLSIDANTSEATIRISLGRLSLDEEIECFLESLFNFVKGRGLHQ